jgi:hypothetical protein
MSPAGRLRSGATAIAIKAIKRELQQAFAK